VKVTECPREQEIVQAVLAGAWASVDDEDLKAHAAQCPTCAEIATIAALMRDDNDQARRDVRVPAAGQVWWRAAVRARLERTQAATQPITWMHGITAAVAIGVLLAVISFSWPALTSNVIGFREAFAWVLPSGEVTTAIVGAFRQSLTLALIVTACLVLAPIALYFALSD
jgi:hypothetical protein